ncbi:hypothetical protein KIPB_005390, partial [Kipferlia bialata]|eukprot:g5390.t1
MKFVSKKAREANEARRKAEAELEREARLLELEK